MRVRDGSTAMVVSALLIGSLASRPALAQDEPGAPGPPPKSADGIEEEPTSPPPAQPVQPTAPAARPARPPVAQQQQQSPAITPPNKAYRADPEWQSGRSRRLAGILLTSIGGGVGLGLGALAGIGWLGCSVTNDVYHDSNCSGWAIASVTGFVLLGVSLAAGIPLIVSGNNQMKQVQYRYVYPQVGIDVRPGGGRLQLSWRY